MPKRDLRGLCNCRPTQGIKYPKKEILMADVSDLGTYRDPQIIPNVQEREFDG